MGVRLTVKMKGAAGGDKARTVMLDEETILLGRDQKCQVQLAQMAVSRNHARIFREGKLFFVEDLGSSYGTQLNGEKLGKGEKEVLKNGDVVAIAQFDVTFERVADVQEDTSNKTMFVSRNLVKDVMKGIASEEHAYFRVMNGPQDGERIQISDAQELVFGRDGGDADVVLNHDLVSRKHAKVRRDWSGTHIEDLRSRNGIKVNKKRVMRATLKDRDEVEIGGVRLLFIDPTEVHDEPVVLGDPSIDELQGEGTLSVGPEPQPAPEPEPPPEEPPPEEPPAEEPPPEEPPPESNPSDTDEDPPPEDQPFDESPHDDLEPHEDGPRKLIDLSNKNTLAALIIGAVLLLIGIVLIVLLLVGA